MHLLCSLSLWAISWPEPRFYADRSKGALASADGDVCRACPAHVDEAGGCVAEDSG